MRDMYIWKEEIKRREGIYENAVGGLDHNDGGSCRSKRLGDIAALEQAILDDWSERSGPMSATPSTTAWPTTKIWRVVTVRDK